MNAKEHECPVKATSDAEHAWVKAGPSSARGRTCSPSLAKLADRIDGDTITSFFENLSTLWEAVTATDLLAAHCWLRFALSRWPCRTVPLEARKLAMVRFFTRSAL